MRSWALKKSEVATEQRTLFFRVRFLKRGRTLPAPPAVIVPTVENYSSMSCQIERKTTAAKVICGLPTFSLCSNCGREICVSCMATCCVMSFCKVCESEHIVAKHQDFRPRPAVTK